MIKVLRIINRFNIGGPTYNVTYLSKFLDDEFETLLVGGLPEEGEADSLYIPKSFGLEPLLIPEMKREPNFKSDIASYKRIKQIIKEFQPDIVHTHAAKAGAIGRKAAADCGVPIILHTFHGHIFHDYFGKVKTEVFKNIERYLAKKSTGIIAISETQKQELGEIYHICPSEKIKVIPLGFDLTKFYEDTSEKRKLTREKYHLQEEDVAVAIIGRLAPIKDHTFFLEAIEKMYPLISDVSFKVFIVGDGELKDEIESKAKALNQQFGKEIIILTSWIKDIATFNAGMDVICLTSKNEGTPVSLIEAQASSIPVISTNVGGVRDIVKDGETGFVVNNIAEFIEKLRYLIKNKEIRQKMSQNGLNYVRDKFSYETLTRNMREYYQELLTEKGIK